MDRLDGVACISFCRFCDRIAVWKEAQGFRCPDDVVLLDARRRMRDACIDINKPEREVCVMNDFLGGMTLKRNQKRVARVG